MKRNNIIKDISVCMKYSKTESFCAVLITLVLGIFPSVLILYETKFIDLSLKIVKSETHFSKIVSAMVIITLIIGLQWLLGVINQILKMRILTNVREKINSSIVEKKMKLDYSCIENPDAYQLMKRVGDSIENKITNAFFEILMLLNLILVVGGLIFLLYCYLGIYTFLMVIVMTPLFSLSIKSGKENFHATRKVNDHKKKVNYLNSLLCGKEASLERILYNFSSEITERWNKEYEKMMRVLIKTQALWFFKMKAGASAIAVMTFLMTLFLLKPLAENRITIGMFTSLVNAGYQLINKLSWEITEVLDQLVKNCSYMQDLDDFYRLRETTCVSPAEQAESCRDSEYLIEFKDVTFRYPGAEKDTLKNVSFQIKAGMHYAFIGENGSGKTTVIKLLLGLYDQYQGQIFIGKKELKTLTKEQISHCFSVVFQDYAQYEISVLENMKLAAPELSKEELEDRVREILNELDMDQVISHLPGGLNAKLGKLEEDSVGISQGQWQKMAIARSLLKKAGIYILDEPGSALDPVSEVKLYEDYYRIMKGRTMISISHRLGCLKTYDEIFLMAAGNMIEKGSHSELLEKSRLYQEMYEKQRRWYSYES